MASKPSTDGRVDSSGMAHSTYSASGSERWLNCSGSIALSAVAPEPRTSVYAEEGTIAHSCLEFMLKNRKNIDGALRAARKKYPQEMIEHCLTAFDWIMTRYAEYPNADFLCETRVNSSDFTCEGQFGTVDCSIAAEFDHLTVIDFKYGAGISVDPSGHGAEGNSQLAYYGLGISHMYHHNFASVSLVIIQPRAFHESGETIREFHMDMDDLLAWKEKFLAGVIRTKKFPDVYTPGSWCKFCPADVICPSLKGDAKHASMFPAVTPLGKPTASARHQEIPLKDLPGLLLVAERAEKWSEAIREYALDRMILGDEIEGWRLDDKRGRRAWKNPEDPDLILYAEENFGSKAWDHSIKSPAQIEKLISLDHPKEVMEEFLGEYCETKSQGFTMKKDSRKNLGDMFEPVVINVTPHKGKRK